MSYKKKFLVIGNNNAVTYKEIFPLIKDGKMQLGFTSNKTMEFRVPQGYKFSRQDGNNLYGNVPAISWFTNLEIKKKPNIPILIKKYNPKDYPQYDNYKAINVDKVKDIPYDYNDVMGVPITILGLQYSDGYIHLLDHMSNEMRYEILGTEHCLPTNQIIGQFEVNSKGVYKRILIEKI